VCCVVFVIQKQTDGASIAVRHSALAWLEQCAIARVLPVGI
jgi:hypothetical protein